MNEFETTFERKIGCEIDGELSDPRSQNPTFFQRLSLSGRNSWMVTLNLEF